MEYWRKVKFITFPEIERIMRLSKWIKLYENPNNKPLTPKQWKKYIERKKTHRLVYKVWGNGFRLSINGQSDGTIR